MFSVFREHLKTGKTKKVVHEFKSTGNAQKAYAKLIELFESSATQHLEQEHLVKVLRDYKLTSQWNNFVESFLTGWSHKLMVLEDMADRNLDDAEKGNILESAILHHDELQQAVTNARLFKSTLASMGTGTTSMNFDSFYDFGRAQALIIDRNDKEKKSMNDKMNNNAIKLCPEN